MHTPTALPADTLFARTEVSEVGLDPSVGNLPLLRFHWQGRTLEPLHRAPWVDDAAFPDSMPPVDRKLSGDFVCMPFGVSDWDPAPIHGWTANSAWTVIAQDDSALHLRLEKTVMGATVDKRLEAAADAPLLYQTHIVRGGSGTITFAHHPMLRVAGGARLFTSPKRLALAADTPIVKGRHALALGARSTDPTAIPAQGGGTIDMTRLPLPEGHEDFISLVEADDATLGWTAVIREAEDDIVFVLKDPKVLPLTMLWHSNGGRLDAPWSGRHIGVLGIEDGIAAGGMGHRAALGETAFSRNGVPTALTLGGTHRIAHVIGAVPRPQGWNTVADIAQERDVLVLREEKGARLDLPFDEAFFS